MLQPEGSDLDTVILCGEGKKELEGIPVGSDRVGADTFQRDHPSARRNRVS